MNWEAVGAIGEIVGALAVFLTLAYLAVQIRQNTNAVRATALDSSVNSVLVVREKLFEDPELMGLYLKGLENPEGLNEIDKARFMLLMQNILWALWNAYSQAEIAELSSDFWESQKSVVRRVFSSQGGEWFLNNYGHEFPASFLSEVSQCLSGKIRDNNT